MRPERHGEPADAAALHERLRHVCWIAGGSDAGKSTIARRTAARYGLHLYSTDDVMSDHASRITPEECPFLSKFMDMDMDERWVNRSPKTMFETFHWFRGEGFSMIVDDPSLARKLGNSREAIHTGGMFLHDARPHLSPSRYAT